MLLRPEYGEWKDKPPEREPSQVSGPREKSSMEELEEALVEFSDWEGGSLDRGDHNCYHSRFSAEDYHGLIYVFLKILFGCFKQNKSQDHLEDNSVAQKVSDGILERGSSRRHRKT